MDLALVFGGGGGKGAYEIGVWKGLREAGIERKFKTVIGTSVGALNAFLFGQQNYYTAERIWKEISHGKILSDNGLRQLLEANYMGKLDVYVYVCCTRTDDVAAEETGERRGLFDLKPDEKWTSEYIKLNSLDKERQIRYLLASSALPVVYDGVIIDGKKHRDGACVKGHNLPYLKAVELGYKRILAIDLEDGPSEVRNINGSKVYILRPSQSIGGMIDGILDFNPQNAEQRIGLGYRDFMEKRNEITSILETAAISSRMPGNIRARIRRMV